MINRDKLPIDFTTCYVCGRVVAHTTRQPILSYDEQGTSCRQDACKLCTDRLRREGLTMLWHGETPIIVGPLAQHYTDDPPFPTTA